MIDAYKNLSSTYYDLIKPQPSDEEYNFYKNYLKKSNRALEPMCGSGRFLIPYSEEGHKIFNIKIIIISGKQMRDCTSRRP